MNNTNPTTEFVTHAEHQAAYDAALATSIELMNDAEANPDHHDGNIARIVELIDTIPPARPDPWDLGDNPTAA